MIISAGVRTVFPEDLVFYFAKKREERGVLESAYAWTLSGSHRQLQSKVDSGHPPEGLDAEIGNSVGSK